MRKLNCAVIGCGRIGCGFDDNPGKMIRTHAGAYFKNPQTNLIALCDVDEKKLKKYSKKYNVSKKYTNSNEMFKNEKLDCISICTLIDSHLDLVKCAAKNGVKGIFLEKPIASSLKTSKEIEKICKKNNMVLVIDHQRRFLPAYHTLKKRLREIGEIQLVNVVYGAGIANTGSHMFDLLRMLFGEVKSIEGKISKNSSNNKKDPNLDLIVEFDSFLCKIHALDFNKYAIFQADVFGTKGIIKLEMINNKFELFKLEKNSPVYKSLKPVKNTLTDCKFSPIELGLQHIIECIKSKKKSISTAYDGYKSLELIIASSLSAQKNKLIKLPLKNDNYRIFSK